MSCREQPRDSIERLTKVVVVAQFRGAGVQRHADAEGKGVRPGFGVRERRWAARAALRASGAVAKAAQKASPMVLNTYAVVVLDGLPQQRIVTGEGLPHGVGVLLPRVWWCLRCR